MIFMNYGILFLLFVIAAAIGAGVAVLTMNVFGAGSGKKHGSKHVIVDTIGANASDFAELYEPTYALAAGEGFVTKDTIFNKWNDIVSSGEYSDEFKAAFEKFFGNTDAWKNKNKTYMKKAAKLIKLVFEAGVIRSDDTGVEADETTAEKYDTLSDTSLEAGVAYPVIAPYWAKDEQVLVKGVIR